MQKSDIAGNQQERRFVELGWIAGIIDGEGHIGINFIKNYAQGAHHWCFVARLVVGMTHFETIRTLEKLLKQNDIGCHIHERKKQSLKHKPCLILTVNGLRRMNKFLDLIKSYLVTKKLPASIMHTWIKHRLEVGKARYNHEDYDFYLSFCESTDRILNDYTLERLRESCFGIDYRIYNKRQPKKNSAV